MAAPAIPPIRLGLIGTGLAVEKPHWPAPTVLADRAAAFPAPAVGQPDRTVVVGENILCRNDLRHARALLDGGAVGRHLARVHGAVQAAGGTIDAPSDFALDVVLIGRRHR